MTHSKDFDLTFKILTVFLTFTIVLLVISEVLHAPLFDWNGRRLVGPVAMTMGLPIYPSMDGAARISGTNGPLYMATFAASALGNTPIRAIEIGVFIALLIFFVPAFLFFKQQAMEKPKGWSSLWPLLGAIFVGLSMNSEALRLSSSMIHADAPALGYSALAITCLLHALQKNRLVWLWLASLFAVFATSSKITVAPILVSIPLYLFFIGQTRWALHSLLSLFTCFIVVQGGAALYFGPAAYVEDNWTSHFSYPWVASVGENKPDLAKGTGARLKVVLGACSELFKAYFFAISLLLVAMGARWHSEKRGKFLAKLESLLSEPYVALLFFSLFLLPGTLVGRVKAGGAMNTQSPFVYFLLLAFVAWFSDVLQKMEKRKAEGAMKVALMLSLFGMLPAIYSNLVFMKYLPTGAQKVSYDYAVEHPGSVYFPEFPLTTLYSDGKVYHSGVAAAEMEEVGYKLGLDEYRLHTPVNMQYLAFQTGRHEYVMERLQDFIFPVGVPELPGWSVFTKQEGSAHAAASKASNPIF